MDRTDGAAVARMVVALHDGQYFAGLFEDPADGRSVGQTVGVVHVEPIVCENDRLPLRLGEIGAKPVALGLRKAGLVPLEVVPAEWVFVRAVAGVNNDEMEPIVVE